MKRFILLFLTLLIVHSFVIAQNNNLGITKIVIDPGHGGKDPGNGGTGRYNHIEKDVVLDISLLLGQYLQEAFPELSIIYTRDTDTFVKLSERTRIANELQADLFVFQFIVMHFMTKRSMDQQLMSWVYIKQKVI